MSEVDAAAPVTRSAIDEAALDLRPYLARTPLVHAPAVSARLGCEVYLKLETVQPTRAFKVRGALNRVLRLPAGQRAAGVVTASNGNHGLGVAYAARTFAIPATVYVPEGANQFRVDAIAALGAMVEHRGRSYHEAYLAAREEAGGRAFVHAYDDADVIAGQGTIGAELCEQLEAFDTVLVPVGGGGLVSGIATYVKAARPAARVIGVEPAGAAGLRRSLDMGRPVILDRVDTIADGLAGSGPGENTWAICRRLLDDVQVVEDEDLLQAMRVAFELEHVLAEPSGAAGLAALLRDRPAAGSTAVVVLSGANTARAVMIEALGGELNN